MATTRLNMAHRKVVREEYSFETFKENLKRQWKNREIKESHRKKADMMPKILMAVQCPTQLYLFLFYIVPRLCEDYSQTTELCLQLFVCFCCFEGLTNYLLCLFTTSHVTSEHSAKMRPGNDYANGHVSNGLTVPRDDGELPWRYCDKCNMHTPPRSHHCKVCKKCILKRDHHCFMVGNCIGFNNQKYFFVLGFYAVIDGLLAAALNAWYLYTFYWPTAYSWTSLFFPVGLFRFVLGYEDIEPHVMALIVQIYPQIFYGGFGFIVVNAQMTMCILGKTAHEVSADVPIKNNNTIHDNFESVFGKYWLMNFIFPVTLFFKQKGDGTSWAGIKIDHKGTAEDNNNEHTVVNMS